jgi:glutamate-5-semialdehyde dehydrogenase
MTLTTIPASGEIREAARAAKKAQRRLAALPTAVKDETLLRISTRLIADQESILTANREDVAEATLEMEAGRLARPLLDRLKIDEAKLAAMAEGVRAVAALPDPANRIVEKTLLDDGLELHRVTCPLGLLAIIFESRPDAVTQICALALKSGNAVILKGGKEAARTTTALIESIHRALAPSSVIPREVISSVTERAEVDVLLQMDGIIDLVIPRGSNDLVRYIQNHTRIPVLGHAEGVCHVYVDASAKPEMAVSICLDAKLQYPAACNAAETILVHHAAAPDVLRPLLGELLQQGVEIRACGETRGMAAGFPLKDASEADWRTEYSAPVISVKIVESLDEAIEHINTFGSGHTETIVTEDSASARRFMDEVDSAGVYQNASTRFADGNRYGLGAEVGISTSKVHARGPVGLEGLVTYKYKLYGHGQVVATYSGKDPRPFKHTRL